MMVGRLLSFWDGLFSGAMLNFQGVLEKNKQLSIHISGQMTINSDARTLNELPSQPCISNEGLAVWSLPCRGTQS